MEDIAFNDWPGQPVDLGSGANSWFPAYGFQPPPGLLEREDFLGNPDADYFFQGNPAPYLYLETIHEETSDDLRSDSDLSEVRGTSSPLGWLATDSETDSVICMDATNDTDSESDREIACPIKRRRQDNVLPLPSEDDYQSLSRSSSLLQFETLEKQCQETSSSSPSIYSQYSIDSLELPQQQHQRKSADEELCSDGGSRHPSCSGSESSDSGDSEKTLAPSKSCNNLIKAWHSLDSIPVLKSAINYGGEGGCGNKSKDKISAENLSEDSGYSDHIKGSDTSMTGVVVTKKKLCKSHSPCFGAYDCEVFQQFTGNFGASCQNLSLFDESTKWMRQTNKNGAINLEKSPECGRRSKFNSASEPNLMQDHSAAVSLASQENVAACSVPKDLDLVGKDEWSAESSIAAKNWDLGDLNRKLVLSDSSGDMASYRREGSYAEAMRNRVDLSDDEQSMCFKKKPPPPRTTLEVFDRKILNVISESIQSINSNALPDAFINTLYSPQAKRNVVSTPNLATNQSDVDSEIMDILMEDDRRRSVQDIPTHQSASTSCISDEIEDKHIKSVCGESSNSNKGVHFSPVVSEVNWRDDSQSTATMERESSYSTSNSSTPDRDVVEALTNMLLDKNPSPPPPTFTSSQPNLSPMTERARFKSQSQPDMSKMKRRGSQLIKKDKDGCIIKAYIDVDGIQYRHTHLELDGKSDAAGPGGGGGTTTATSRGGPPLNDKSHVSSGSMGGGKDNNKHRRAVAGMDVVNSDRDEQRKKSAGGKLGGFFSRLASFRFSNRKNAEEKAKKKKDSGGKKDATTTLQPQQKVATKDDYIYIPLKGPSPLDANPRQQETVNSSINNNNSRPHNGGLAVQADYRFQEPPPQVLRNKPPLPNPRSAAAAPPRVVGACVKRDGAGGVALHRDDYDDNHQQRRNHHHHHHHHHHQQQQQQQHRRRRTIDCGDPCCPRPMEPMGLIETDLDTEVTVITSGANVKTTRSLLNLGAEPRLGGGLLDGTSARCGGVGGGTEAGRNLSPGGRPHKSMEFLLDKQNLKVVEPPENELQKGERVMSEHQLRVQRSLQKLTVPEWYKQNQVPREGFLLRKSSNRETKWAGTGSKTTSLSSLGSANTQSPVTLSPTSQPFVRWSTSKLNSTASSPCASTRSSFNARQPNGSISPSSVRSSFSYRQPYMGWRSQERLTRPRTPAERLANSVLSQTHQSPHQPQVEESPDFQSSIKEMTSAIVHYVSGLKPENDDDQRSKSSSPRGSQKLCWLESSFVGIRPLDSPQTPVGLCESQSSAPPTSLRLELQTHNEVSLLSSSAGPRPSPGSTTLEDVLDSLLGLPSSDRAPSPSLQGTASANTSPSRLGESSRMTEQYRRRSEGSEPAAPILAGSGSAGSTVSRRVSFQSSPVLQCRYSRCSRVVAASSSEGSAFKNCHNCSYTYCSRACRRAHWEKHRKTCLFSRIGTLCRQVIAAVKEQKDSLLHLSTVARRGYLSHGTGAVKCFFPCPEAAEKFLFGGLNSLGELTYVRWPDLLPSEMGPQLYAELVQMCKTYNPDTKLVLYVSVCVVSETPASGAVKWERQLVSRCAKMRLSKDISIPEKDPDNPETLILTCNFIEATDDTKAKELKEISINNVQKQLRQRGVSLKRQHPVIFKQLCAYAEGSCAKFTPITVYPKDITTGKSFMCIIMLEADPDSLRQVELAGVRVRTVDVLCDTSC